MATVQNEMKYRTRMFRLMKDKKRYECGELVRVTHRSLKGDAPKEEFHRKLEVGSYEDALRWMNGELDET